ncbi:hypothetical protein TVNIR_3579 [Thioalkalivibrio nitratireducens DSM 14787]|uniref:Uncharacterized protein n=1 Tax=Thioalkalivibrio nitratireducens (strain DSM 14787 / UNIQEM 213 / ALEN2) TaxID=1255043 RepID=L0E037_THIND|nr:hypothetical protein TVNIR_3579 [Thioalkalivibrio nitratireducens DSM 14787]
MRFRHQHPPGGPAHPCSHEHSRSPRLRRRTACRATRGRRIERTCHGIR